MKILLHLPIVTGMTEGLFILQRILVLQFKPEIMTLVSLM